MNKIKLLGVMSTVAFSSTAFSYQMWIGTSYTPKSAIAQAAQWDRTAASATGMNINLTDAQLPNAEQNTNADWRAILATYALATNNALIPVPRSGVQSVEFPTKPTIPVFLTKKFQNAADDGYAIGFIMIYNNQTQGERFPWQESEVQAVRNWLNNNGHSSVKLVWNARTFGEGDQFWCQNPLIDWVLMEAEPSKWFDNVGKRQDLLRWLTTNNATKNKGFIFQVPLNNVTTGLSPYKEMRRLVRWFSTPEMLGSTAMVRRANTAFLPVIYNGNVLFHPETTNSDTRYAETLTGTVLSLIEQRNAFEGRPALVSVNKVESLVR